MSLRTTLTTDFGSRNKGASEHVQRKMAKDGHGHISAMGHSIHFMFGFRVGFLRMADRTALLSVWPNQRRWACHNFVKFRTAIYQQRSSDPLHVLFYGRVFEVGRTNGAISGCTKFKMAISRQRVIWSTSCLVLGRGFRELRTEWRPLHQTKDGGRSPSWKILNGHISAMAHPMGKSIAENNAQEIITRVVHKFVTKKHNFGNFQSMKKSKYTFCTEFYAEYKLWALLRWRHCDVIYRH